MTAITDTAGIAATSTASTSKDDAKLKTAAKGFEAVFIRQILHEMREGGFGDDLMGSSAVEQFQSMSDANVADTMAERGTFGIAQSLITQLSPKQATAAYASAKGSAE